MMNHRTIRLTVLALGLLPFSSCTCRETIEPPPRTAAVERRGGFGAVVSPRKLPDRAGMITPHEREAAERSPVPTSAPTPQPASVPENFPEGVPIPEGAEVMAVQSLANDARNVIFTAEGDAPELFTLYRDSMVSNGWGQPTQEFQGKDHSFLSFKRGDTITNISVSKDPKTGKRVVAVMYYDETPLPFPEF